MLYFREGQSDVHVRDILGILRVSGPEIDTTYVAEWAERLGLNMEQAFATLRNHARSHNLLLVDVARNVISGALGASALDPLPSSAGSSVLSDDES